MRYKDDVTRQKNTDERDKEQYREKEREREAEREGKSTRNRERQSGTDVCNKVRGGGNARGVKQSAKQTEGTSKRVTYSP